MRVCAFLVCVALGPCAIACGSNSSSQTKSSQPLSDPTTVTAPAAQGIAITQVAALQVLKVPLAKNGNPASHGGIPIIAGRDLVVRVYVTPDSTFNSGTDITARLKIANPLPTGEMVTEVFTLDMPVSGASSEGDLKSTFDFQVPGAVVTPETQYSVALEDPKGKAGSDNPDASYPNDGSLDPLGATSAGPHVKVLIVPVKYMADGSGRLPDTSETAMKGMHDWMYKLYPTPDVELTIRAPWTWNQAIDAGGGGWGEILQALQGLRDQDKAPPDLYYYASFRPAPQFFQYCGGGCIAGLSMVGIPVSSGIGYGDDESALAMAHEVGHAHGRQHAPCGGAAGPDPQFPYGNGGIGVWGYDQLGGAMVDPKQAKDIMGYCQPNWISDFHYERIFARVRADNRVTGADWVAHERRAYRMVSVDGAGRTTWGDATWTEEPAGATLAHHAVTYVAGDGSVVASDTAFFAPYDHLPGGVLFVPERGDAAVARVRIAGYGDVAPAR